MPTAIAKTPNLKIHSIWMLALTLTACATEPGADPNTTHLTEDNAGAATALEEQSALEQRQAPKDEPTPLEPSSVSFNEDLQNVSFVITDEETGDVLLAGGDESNCSRIGGCTGFRPGSTAAGGAVTYNPGSGSSNFCEREIVNNGGFFGPALHQLSGNANIDTIGFNNNPLNTVVANSNLAPYQQHGLSSARRFELLEQMWSIQSPDNHAIIRGHSTILTGSLTQAAKPKQLYKLSANLIAGSYDVSTAPFCFGLTTGGSINGEIQGFFPNGGWSGYRGSGDYHAKGIYSNAMADAVSMNSGHPIGCVGHNGLPLNRWVNITMQFTTPTSMKHFVAPLAGIVVGGPELGPTVLAPGTVIPQSLHTEERDFFGIRDLSVTFKEPC